MLRRRLQRFLFVSRYCLRHPSFLTTYARRWHLLGKLDARFRPGEMKGYAKQFREVYRGLARRIERHPYLGSMDPRKYEVSYSLVRTLRPSRVIETGVAAGVSSFVILEALSRNRQGHLISIDAGLSEFDGIALSVPVGFFVPEDLLDRWTLKIGLSQQELPKLQVEGTPFQVFLHDSDHSYSNMTWEFKFAWSGLDRAGVLVSDNVELNLAFGDFIAKTGCSAVTLYGLGVAVKP